MVRSDRAMAPSKLSNLPKMLSWYFLFVRFILIAAFCQYGPGLASSKTPQARDARLQA